jgi:hypothetical protein
VYRWVTLGQWTWECWLGLGVWCRVVWIVEERHLLGLVGEIELGGGRGLVRSAGPVERFELVARRGLVVRLPVLPGLLLD